MAQELYSVEQVANRLGLHVRTIRNYVRDLRKLVGDQVLPEERGPVRLILDRERIDYWRFRKLFDRAQVSAGEERRHALREALNLWQPGEPLGNVGQAHLHDLAADLTTRHRRTCLDLIAANLEFNPTAIAAREAKNKASVKLDSVQIDFGAPAKG